MTETPEPVPDLSPLSAHSLYFEVYRIGNKTIEEATGGLKKQGHKTCGNKTQERDESAGSVSELGYV